MTRPALLALAVLLAAPLAFAVEPPTLTAEPTPEGVRARVDADTGSAPGLLVVSHHDPLAGTVIDRAVPLPLDEERAVEVVVEQLRRGVPLNVSVLPIDPATADLTELLNGTLGNTVTPLVETLLGTLPRLDDPFPLHAYPWAPFDGGAMRHARVIGTPTGGLAIAYIIHDEAYVVTSPDGGHRWNDPLPVAPNRTVDPTQANNRGGLTHTVAPDGSILLLALHNEVDAQAPVTGWTLARLDPTGRELERTYVAATTADLRRTTPALLPDGTALALRIEYDGQVAGPRAFRLNANGTLTPGTLAETDPNAWPASDEVAVGAGPLGALVAVWHVGDTFDPEVRVAHSLDAGATWLDAHTVPDLPGRPSMPTPISLAVDATGTAHFTLDLRLEHGNETLRYVRAPPGAQPTLRAPGTDLPWTTANLSHVSHPHTIIAGTRVWIFANIMSADEVITNGSAVAARSHAVAWESLDAGLTFAGAHEVQVQGIEGVHLGEGQPGTMPDGRPVLLGSGPGYYAVPYFDPFPEPACAQRDPPRGTPTPVMTTGPREAPETCPDAFTLNVIPGGVRVRPLEAQSIGDPDPVRLPAPSFPDVAPEVATGAAATLAAAALLSTLPARYGLGLLAARLFARVRGRKVLHHTVRENLHDHIRQNPGIRFSQIRRDLGLSHGRAAHHLRVLEQNRLVRVREVWTRRRYYPAEGPPPTVEGPARDVVLELLRQRPGIRPSEIARELGISRQLVNYHLRRLERGGRAARDPAGGP